MKKLYLVPIIHMSADMGSLALALNEEAAVGLGQELWQKHKEIISRFWDAIANFFNSLDVQGYKIYQDGLVADGSEGHRIIEEGIKLGSKNYEIIGKLLEKGAIVIKTEDPALVKQEHSYLAKIAKAKYRRGKEVAALRYKLAQGKLLKERDDFIAKIIDITLGQGETGILFIGAYHNVQTRLPEDIQLIEVKSVAKVRKYQILISSKKGLSQEFLRLAEYLVSPIDNTVAR